jgi:hypothetical protein
MIFSSSMKTGSPERRFRSGEERVLMWNTRVARNFRRNLTGRHRVLACSTVVGGIEWIARGGAVSIRPRVAWQKEAIGRGS